MMVKIRGAADCCSVWEEGNATCRRRRGSNDRRENVRKLLVET
jgi:hypothetical protein